MKINVSELVTRAKAIADDLVLIRDAVNRQVIDLSERAQSAPIIAHNLGTVQTGLDELITDAGLLHAAAVGLDGVPLTVHDDAVPVVRPGSSRSGASKKKSARKRR